MREKWLTTTTEQWAFSAIVAAVDPTNRFATRPLPTDPTYSIETDMDSVNGFAVNGFAALRSADAAECEG